MFSTGSQRKYWTFGSDGQLDRLRYNANLNYINSVKNPKQDLSQVFLNVSEELIIVRYYEKMLWEFLMNFRPRKELLPREVKSTTFHLFKRFYLVNSVMDYHPKEIMITCIFLSCKICEYLVPIDLFVSSIDGDANLLKNIILDQELEVLARIKFQIHIVNPYRSIDGLLLDLKARSNLHRPERLHEHIKKFLSGMWDTDICLLYAPPQIGLAAVMHACSRCKENIDSFIMNTLLNCPPPDKMNNIIKVVREIRTRWANVKRLPPMEEIYQLEARLAQCRNPRNNPASEV